MLAVALTIPTDRLAAFMLALVRASAWIVITPPFSSNAIPSRVKVLIAASLALVLAPTVTVSLDVFQFWPFVSAVVYQSFVGLALGFSVYLVFMVVQVAGELIDLQAGFSAAQLYDPFTNAAATPVGRLYQLMATTILFAINGHLLLVRGFMTSFQAAPVGGLRMNDLVSLFTHDLGQFLMSAVEIAAPLLAALFLTELALGLLSRAAPQVHIMTIGFIIKILLTLLLIGVALPVLPDVVDALLGHSLRSMTRLVGG